MFLYYYIMILYIIIVLIYYYFSAFYHDYSNIIMSTLSLSKGDDSMRASREFLGVEGKITFNFRYYIFTYSTFIFINEDYQNYTKTFYIYVITLCNFILTRGI